MSILLSRDNFRSGVFARDSHACVMCGDKENPVFAHHIMERRLFCDGGYYLDNGATVCEPCHILCEQTNISTEQVREAAGIGKIILPDHLYDDQKYDKWGNICQDNGTRLRGELFFDESVQKVLKAGQALDLFLPYTKYGRTSHHPLSPGMHDDDRRIKSLKHFIGKDTVFMEKMDGENMTVYQNNTHARSVNSGTHPSRNRAKAEVALWQHDLPDFWRVCGENMGAKHSIFYDDLPAYFLGFSIWNEVNFCLDWDTTLEWFALLGIPTPKVLWRGIYDEDIVKQLGRRDWEKHEGFVMRTAEGFSLAEFGDKMAKYVRKGHVQTTKHWMHGQEMVPNLLAGGK